jgi:hypothetical protein
MLLFIMRRDAEMSDHPVRTMKEYIANDFRLVGKGYGPLPIGPEQAYFYETS